MACCIKHFECSGGVEKCYIRIYLNICFSVNLKSNLILCQLLVFSWHECPKNLKAIQTHPEFQGCEQKQPEKPQLQISVVIIVNPAIFSLHIFYFRNWLIATNTNITRCRILLKHTHWSLLSFTVSLFFFPCLWEDFFKTSADYNYWQSGIITSFVWNCAWLFWIIVSQKSIIKMWW